MHKHTWVHFGETETLRLLVPHGIRQHGREQQSQAACQPLHPSEIAFGWSEQEKNSEDVITAGVQIQQ